MKNISLFAVATISIFLFSCQKEGSNNELPQNDLKGAWNLLYIDVEGESSTEITSEDLGSLKAVAVMDYITTNNKGTLTFNDSKVVSNNLGGIKTRKFIEETVVKDL